MTAEGYLSKRQAAEYAGVSVRLLDRWRHDGDLPFFRVGSRKVLIRPADLDTFMERFRVDVTEADA